MGDERTIYDGSEYSSDSDATVYEGSERSSDSDATVYEGSENSSDGDATVYESGSDGDATVYENSSDGDATVYESSSNGDATVYESSSDRDATVYEERDATVEEKEEETPVGLRITTGFAMHGTPRKGGYILGTYRVDSDAIHGGMGSIWRVHHEIWNVDLAMKRPKPSYFVTEKQRDDFTEECNAWIRLGLHPNIVSCYYVRRIEDVPTIFSEWMDRGSLEDCIQDRSLYQGSEEEVKRRLLDIAIQFARGLHFAHEQGLIHQDVKPANLLLNKNWEAKVSDFGLAKARTNLAIPEDPWRGSDGDPSATIVTPAGGKTPAYCSPEQAGNQPLTRRSDIYSWAVSVLEMYLGSKPWAHGRELTGPMVGTVCNEYFPMCRVPIPERLQRLLARCLANDPDDRYHDFGRVEVALREIYTMETGESYPRPAPQSAANTADSLNNRALSMIDLGQPEKALELWDAALAVDTRNVNVLTNQSLFLWRTGKYNDVELHRIFRQLEEEYGAVALCDNFFRERGSSSFEITVPEYISGRGSDGRRNLLAVSACLDRGIISFLTRERVEDEVYLYVRQFDVNTGRGIGFWPDPGTEPQILFSPKESRSILSKDGRHLFVAMTGGEANLWDVRSQTLLKEYHSYAEQPKEYKAFESGELPIGENLYAIRNGHTLFVKQMGNHRILQTLELPALSSADSEKERYPEILVDGEGKQLVLYSRVRDQLRWYLLPLDSLIGKPGSMPYRVSYPTSIHEATTMEQKVQQCLASFEQAAEQKDVQRMLAGYEKMKNYSKSEGKSPLLRMNEVLLRYRKPVGLYGIGPAADTPEHLAWVVGLAKDRWECDYCVARSGKEHRVLYISGERTGDQRILERTTLTEEIYLQETGEILRKEYGIGQEDSWVNQILAMDPTGRIVILEVGDRKAPFHKIRGYEGDFRILRLDLEKGESRGIAERKSLGAEREWCAQPESGAVLSWVSRNSYFWMNEPGKEERETINLPEDTCDPVKRIVASRDGKQVLVCTAQKLFIYEPGTAVWKPFFASDAKIGRVIPTDDLKMMLVTIERGYGALDDWMLVRTEDGEVLWKDTSEAFGSSGEANRLAAFEEGNLYLTDLYGNHVSSCFWEFETPEDPVV